MPIQSVCRKPRLTRRGIGCVCAIASALLYRNAAGAGTENVDLAALPIEQLLSLEVYSASKFVQKLSDAPSSVSVITAADIKAFGWQTVADILRSVRGLYVSYDRNYSYLGARGFLRPGDYNSRFLLLVDGNRNNDVVFDQGSIGSESVLDVDMIERIEFAPGPGSSIYGANAFFGVINIVTKRGRDLNGAQTSVEYGSYGMRKARASYGKLADNGVEWLLSASVYRQDGQDLYYPEFDTPATNNGIAHRLDYDRAENLLMKGAFGPFSITAAHNERKKGIPTASFGQTFNDPRSYMIDALSFVDVGYRSSLAEDVEWSSRLYFGHYNYIGNFAYDYPPLVLNRDGADGRWWGAEAKLVSRRFASHKLVAGLDYQRDTRRNQYNYDIDPYRRYMDDRRSGDRLGIYLQDEIALRKDLLLNAGARYDHHSSTGDNRIDPRLALIYKASGATTLKAMTGTAFRAPNVYELYYDTGSLYKANPSLKAERIRTQEVSVEHYFSPDSRMTASVFRNDVKDLVSQTVDPADGKMVFQNLDRATARGLELELEQAWTGGARLRTSYSWQEAKDAASGAILVNSPRHLAKFNLSAPIPRTTWRAGVEAQYVGPRYTLQAETGGYWLGNLTVSAIRLAPGLELSASVYNLFDRRYADPGTDGHVQDVIAQNGRTYRVKLVYAF